MLIAPHQRVAQILEIYTYRRLEILGVEYTVVNTSSATSKTVSIDMILDISFIHKIATTECWIWSFPIRCMDQGQIQNTVLSHNCIHIDRSSCSNKY